MTGKAIALRDPATGIAHLAMADPDGGVMPLCWRKADECVCTVGTWRLNDGARLCPECLHLAVAHPEMVARVEY
ncbi:MAG: hypothetical protein GX649_17775 [Chloroflexi bacterium]|nr:hypothetical protein [Chloroflexota bacterium]